MNTATLEQLLEPAGPLTGAEIIARTQGEPLRIWQLCRNSERFRMQVIGKRYLRLDRQVDGYARLSPSIRREFLTYTIVALPQQQEAAQAKARALTARMAQINQAKTNLARESVAMALSGMPREELVLQHACLMIAGDITYGMAHEVPRPESSTGQMVRGSDLDIIVIADDELPQALMQAVDDAIYRQKHYLLAHPDYREEIDYLVKDFTKVRHQIEFAAFEDMVACKIMDEALLLYGSPFVFQQVKAMLQQHQISERIAQLTRQAAAERQQAETGLLNMAADETLAQHRHLFYTREESEEIF